MKEVLAKDRRTNDKATTVLGEEAPGLVLDVFESQLHFDLLSPGSSVRGGHILSLQIHMIEQFVLTITDKNRGFSVIHVQA
jgi:hypothetical protein